MGTAEPKQAGNRSVALTIGPPPLELVLAQKVAHSQARQQAQGETARRGNWQRGPVRAMATSARGKAAWTTTAGAGACAHSTLAAAYPEHPLYSRRRINSTY